MKKTLIGCCGAALLGVVACGSGEDGLPGENGTHGENGTDGDDGENGTDGDDGEPCTVEEQDDGSVVITCGDESSTLSAPGMGGSNGTDGQDGDDGTSCSVTDNGDGSATVACTDGTSATIHDGADGDDGTSCSVTDNGDGSSTVACTDGTSATIYDGADGNDGTDGGGVLVATDSSSSTSDLGDIICAAYENLAVTITVPSSGNIVVNGTAWLRIDHTSGTEDKGHVGLSTAQDSCAPNPARAVFTVPENVVTSTMVDVTVPVHRTFAVEAGTHTFYLVGAMTAGFNGTDSLVTGDRFWYANATAVFIPD